MNDKPKRLLIIIPAWNEEQSLPIAITDLKVNDIEADMLVVDDGSRDNTSLVARSYGCKTLVLPQNLGIGGAVQSGLLYAAKHNYEFAIQFDADGQHLASEIEKILSVVRDGHADVAIGSRFLKAGGFKSSIARRMGIYLFRFVISAAIHRSITDATSGFRAYNKDVIHYLANDYPCDYPEVEAVVILAKRGYHIKEVAVDMRERQAGFSSIKPLQSVYYMVKVMLAILMTILRGSHH